MVFPGHQPDRGWWGYPSDDEPCTQPVQRPLTTYTQSKEIYGSSGAGNDWCDMFLATKRTRAGEAVIHFLRIFYFGTAWRMSGSRWLISDYI
jgi:hypothetical protein